MEDSFHVGDKAYYPVHGVAEVVALEDRDIGGSTTPVYVLKILESGLKIMVPKSNASAVGLREIMNDEDVREIYDILRCREITSDSQTWNRRYREYMDKIKTGSAFEIAEVLRDLYMLKSRKELSFGEKRMLETAQNLLVREISLSRKKPETVISEEISAIFVAPAA